MVNLQDRIGTMCFTEKGNYIVGATEKQNEAFRAKIYNLDIDVETLRERIKSGDYVQIKGITQTVLTSENYNDFCKVKGMPKALFGNEFGYKMQKDISACMRDYYAGKISSQDVKDYFNECCSAMRLHCAGERFTNGQNEADNMQIVGAVYEIFAKENARAARGANYQEGLSVCEELESGGRTDDWVYYNSDYYYQCEETKSLLREAADAVTDKWGTAKIDYDDIEKNSKFTLDGGFDFNSGWNWSYRNQTGRASMENEAEIPPRDFKFFYKENMLSGGSFMKIWGEDGDTLFEKSINVPFDLSGNSLKGQIFNAADLFKFTEKDHIDYRQYNSFLKNITVFTRWYAQVSGVNNKFGNLTPQYR